MEFKLAWFTVATLAENFPQSVRMEIEMEKARPAIRSRAFLFLANSAIKPRQINHLEDDAENKACVFN